MIQGWAGDSCFPVSDRTVVSAPRTQRHESAIISNAYEKRNDGARIPADTIEGDPSMTFFTANICDEYSDRVVVLGAGYSNYGGADKCQGEVVTIKLDRNNSDLITLLRDVDGTGKVVVVDVDQTYYAVVGETLMNFAQQNNYAGIIINGYIRDSLQIRNIPVALYALGTCPRKYIPVTTGEEDVPLVFGGAEFNSGDYLYADTDGVIVTAEKIV
jgi:regulator of ribonuclease activity A